MSYVTQRSANVLPVNIITSKFKISFIQSQESSDLIHRWMMVLARGLTHLIISSFSASVCSIFVILSLWILLSSSRALSRSSLAFNSVSNSPFSSSYFWVRKRKLISVNVKPTNTCIAIAISGEYRTLVWFTNINHNKLLIKVSKWQCLSWTYACLSWTYADCIVGLLKVIQKFLIIIHCFFVSAHGIIKGRLQLFNLCFLDEIYYFYLTYTFLQCIYS